MYQPKQKLWLTIIIIAINISLCMAMLPSIDIQCVRTTRKRLGVYVWDKKKCSEICPRVEAAIWDNCKYLSSCYWAKDRCWYYGDSKNDRSRNECYNCVENLAWNIHDNTNYIDFFLTYYNEKYRQTEYYGNTRNLVHQCGCSWNEVTRLLTHGELKKLKDLGLTLDKIKP